MIDNKYKKIALILGIIALILFLIGVIWFGSTAGNVDEQYVKINSDVKEIEVGWGYQLEISKSINASNSIEYVSSNNEVLSVSNTGYMEAKSPGEAVVTVRIKEKTKINDSITITVIEPKEKLVLSEKSVYLKPNEERKIYVYNTNLDGYLIWESSDDYIATVNDGLIKGLNYGEADIKVTNENDVSEIVKVKVLSPEEEETIELIDLYIYEGDVGLDVGETLQLTPVFDPREVSDKSLVWTTSNPDAVTVSEDGLLTAVGDGNATITAKAYNGLTAKSEATSTTHIIAITDIKLSTDNVSLDVGDGYTIKATISPSNATSKNVRWTSSDTSVATVRGGVIIALKEGTTTITATTNNGKTASAKVTVKKKIIEPYSISLDKTNSTINVGGKVTLFATITPSNAQNKTVTWSSSDKSIATVSNGQVTGLKTGTVTITAKTFNGKTATATVKVTDQVVNVQSISLSNTNLTLNAGSTYTLRVTFNPTTATNQNITWTSSNTGVATVTATGLVKGVKGGTATITARSSNGKIATCDVEVKKADDKITIRLRTSSYTGNPIAASISAQSGTLESTTYYSNSTCTTKTNSSNAQTEGGPPVESGTYYVIAKSRGNNTYNPVTSPCTEAVIINKKKATLTCASKQYNGKAQVIATCNGGNLQNATQTNVGTYEVGCTGTGAYSDANPRNCQITPKSISTATVSGLSDQRYTGSPITPTPIVTITLDGVTKTLTHNVDYTYTYRNNTNAGTASVVISGKGNYNGSKTANFNILKEPATVRCANKTYNGATQVIAVCTGGTPNSEANKINAGTYNVGCNPDSGHSAPTPIPCKIEPYHFTTLTVSGLSSKPYTGNPVSPSSFTVQVNINGTVKAMNNGTDYTYTVSNNTNVGYANVTITGKGNYTGTFVTSFQITPIPAVIVCHNKPFNNTEQTIAECRGGTVHNAKQTNAGNYVISCTGDNNHTAAEQKSCSISKIDDVPEITHKFATYYGQQVEAIVTAVTCSSSTPSNKCDVVYYTDQNCTRTVQGKPVQVGTYWAKATSKGNNNYNRATSKCTKAITIQ